VPAVAPLVRMIAKARRGTDGASAGLCGDSLLRLREVEPRRRKLAAGHRAGGEEDLRARREALWRDSERLGELAREDLVADHEYELQDICLREVLPNPRKACVRDLSVIGDDFLSDLERGLFARRETVALPPVGQRG